MRRLYFDQTYETLRPLSSWHAFRFVLPGYPQHIIQRQQPPEDPARKFRLLVSVGEAAAAAQKFRCDVHAYALMPNHFHLLLTPWRRSGYRQAHAVRWALLCAALQSPNSAHPGTLWEGRYRATLLDPAAYLLLCSRYVRGTQPRKGWIHGQTARLRLVQLRLQRNRPQGRLVKPHPEYQKLGGSQQARQSAYHKSFSHPIDEGIYGIRRDYSTRPGCWTSFCQDVEDRLNQQATRH